MGNGAESELPVSRAEGYDQGLTDVPSRGQPTPWRAANMHWPATFWLFAILLFHDDSPENDIT